MLQHQGTIGSNINDLPDPALGRQTLVQQILNNEFLDLNRRADQQSAVMSLFQVHDKELRVRAFFYGRVHRKVFVSVRWEQQAAFLGCLALRMDVREWQSYASWFERFIIFVILLNTIFLALQDYSFRQTGSDPPASWTDSIEYLFTSVFIVEFILKIVAMGFVMGRNTYLRDGWNFIDFVVVVTGFISFFIPARISAIRVIRIIRPLRSINSLKQMRVLVTTLIDSLPALGNVVIFLLFVIILFGILGLQIFMSILENRCRLTPVPVDGEWKASSYAKLCSDTSSCPEGTYCGNPANYNLPVQDTFGAELNYGYTNFDNIIAATFSIFQSLTTEGWSVLIQIYSEAVAPAIVYIYFLLLIFMGSFFVVNLILAVINESFVNANDTKSLSLSQNKSNQDDVIGDESENQNNAQPAQNGQFEHQGIPTSNLVQPEQNEPLEPPENQQNLAENNPLNQNSEQKHTQTEFNQQPSPRVGAIEIRHNNVTPLHNNTYSNNPSQSQLPHDEQAPFDHQWQKQIQSLMLMAIERKEFTIFITAIIVMNTITLSLDRYPISQTEIEVLDVFNKIFTVIFCLELTMKLIAYGTNFIRDQLNIFDTLIVILSVVEWILDTQGSSQSGGSFSAIQAFRTLRLFRLFKLARTWVSFRRLLATIVATVAGITNFVILLLLFMVISSLLGMELFAYQTNERYNFNNFLRAMLSVFMLLTNEGWNTMAYSYMQAMDSIYPVLYFIVIIIFGNFILLKLFIAILINNFHDASISMSGVEEEHGKSSNAQVAPLSQPLPPTPSVGNRNSASQLQSQYQSQFKSSILILTGKSLYLFDAEHKFRVQVNQLINHQYFEYFILFVIIFSSVMLALDDPLTEKTVEAFLILDEIITVIFICEALLKIIAKGFLLNGPDSYMRQPANLLDVVVIIFSSFTFDPNSSQTFSKIKVLRVIRVLRPLRLILRNDELKMAINALVNSLAQMLNITLIVLIFFLLFGIFGVAQFKGAYYYCDIPEAEDKLDCWDQGGSWVNKAYNFDNVINAIVTLFVISTTEGWINLMSDGIDSRAIGLNPKVDSSPAYALYFVFFIIVGSYFLLNLFAGVIVDAFLSEREKLSHIGAISEREQEWYDTLMKIYGVSPRPRFRPPKAPLLRKLYSYLITNQFELFILVCIILNTSIMMLQFSRQPKELGDAIQAFNWIFLSIFTVEAILKLVVYGKTYFAFGWNLFDFSVVLLTFLGVILEQSNVLSNIGTATSILRTFRIFRVLRLVKSAKNLRIIFGTLLVTLPGLMSIGALLVIMLFIFAIIFMNLYPYVKFGEGITEFYNFSSFGKSIFTLFKSSTGEDWNLIMADAQRSMEPNNVCLDISDAAGYVQSGFMGCGNAGAVPLMILFQIIVSLIMLNLFVAVIIEGFQDTSEEENSKVRKADVDGFVDTWKEFDRSATGFISCARLSQLLLLLPPPLGWKQLRKSPLEQRRSITNLRLPVYKVEGRMCYFFYDVLKNCAQDYFEIQCNIFNFEIENEKARSKIQIQQDVKYAKVIQMATEFTSAHYTSVMMIQKNSSMIKKREAMRARGQQVIAVNKSTRNPVPVQKTIDDEVEEFMA